MRPCKSYFEIIMWIGLETFAVVDETGEDNNAQHQKEDEQRQFLCRSFECVYLHEFKYNRIITYMFKGRERGRKGGCICYISKMYKPES